MRSKSLNVLSTLYELGSSLASFVPSGQSSPISIHAGKLRGPHSLYHADYGNSYTVHSLPMELAMQV